MDLVTEDVSADLVTVVGNLVDNALDAVERGGWVEVEVRTDPDDVIVSVRDSGPGVAPELADEVFRRGYTTKAAAEGHRGLGLALTRLVCSRRGGFHPGRRLHVHRERAASAKGPAMIRVLVVDDDFMVAKVHCGFVELMPGFSIVGVAHTGEETLSAVERSRPDLVLLDIYLPDMSGLDVLRRLRDSDTPTDVLVITAARDVATIRTALRGGVVHYLIKPFTFDVLRDRLERYAAAHRRLASFGAVVQDDVDRLFGALRPTSPQLPKGLTKSTADLVAKALQAADSDLSAAECAERAGLSRVSTRRYLEYFVALGKADVRQRYGAAGRPERRFRWAGG